MPKTPKILSLAAAVAALGTPVALSTGAAAKTADKGDVATQPKQSGEPNTLLSVGHDLLGFTVSHSADGILLVDHFSHSSHSSHASHFSSRY